MGQPIDLGGEDLYVNQVYTGNTGPGQLNKIGDDVGVSLTANTTLTSSQTGVTFILNALAGLTVTLPAPVVGTTFTFYVGTVPTSNAYKIITDASTTFLAGGIYVDKALTITRYDANGSTIRSISLNGTTTGGATIGDSITLVCVTATQWSIQGTYSASGTLATPFATS